jgi:hypothetical protein
VFFRRRSALGEQSDLAESDLEQSFVYDPDLGQEVLRFNEPLRKQILVEPATKVDRLTASEEQGRALGQGGNV